MAQSEDYRSVTTVAGIQEYIGDARVIAFDYETAPDIPFREEDKAALDPAKSHIVGCSYSVEEGTAIYVPIAHLCGENVDTAEFWKFQEQFLTNPEVTKVAHNLSFEAMMSYHLRWRLAHAERGTHGLPDEKTCGEHRVHYLPGEGRA